MSHYIYIIHVREFLESNRDIYKIGRTSKGLDRLKGYPKGSKLIFLRECEDSVIMEREIIIFLKKKYEQQNERYGTEYFKGNKKEMIKDINNILDTEEVITKVSPDENQDPFFIERNLSCDSDNCLNNSLDKVSDKNSDSCLDKNSDSGLDSNSDSNSDSDFFNSPDNNNDNNSDNDYNNHYDNDEVNKTNSIPLILSANDIDNDEFEILLLKQKRDEATKEEKFKIKKHFYKLSLGLDKIDENILNKFNLESIPKFISLINEKNIKHSDRNEKKKFLDKARFINNLILALGFNNIFDTTTISANDFYKNSEKVIDNIFSTDNVKNIHTKFGKKKKKVEIYSMKQFLKYVNSLMDSYNVSIGYCRKMINGEKTNFYGIKLRNNINELLEYRIAKGLILKDPDNIRIPMEPDKYIYKEYVNL